MEKDKLVEQVARTPIESHRYKQRRYLTIECIERLISLIRPSIEQEARKQFMEFKCDECSTPGFIHFIVPIDKLKEAQDES